MSVVGDRRENETRMTLLQRSLERAFNRAGSLTDARVLRISSMLDEAVVAHIREQSRREQ